jgi:hypothetical protein
MLDFLFLVIFLLSIFWIALSIFKKLFPEVSDNPVIVATTNENSSEQLSEAHNLNFYNLSNDSNKNYKKTYGLKLLQNAFIISLMMGFLFLYKDELNPFWLKLKCACQNKILSAKNTNLVPSETMTMQTINNSSETSNLSISDQFMKKIGLPTSKERIEEYKKLKEFQDMYKKQMEILKKSKEVHSK